jgi:hypothetical protein
MIIEDESSKVNSLDEPNFVYIVHQDRTGQFISTWQQLNSWVRYLCSLILFNQFMENKLLTKRRKYFHFKTIVGTSNSTEEATRQQTTEAPVGHCGGTCGTGHFRRFIKSEQKLAAAHFFQPSSWMITFDEWTVYTAHF